MSRLLLRHAVHSAESPNEVARINRDYFARGEQRGQCVERDAVVGIVEDRREHDAVGDVEICVACRQASLFEDDCAGHGKFDDVQRLAGLIARGLQAVKIFAQRFVIHVFADCFRPW